MDGLCTAFGNDLCFKRLGDSVQGLHEVKELTDQAAAEGSFRINGGVDWELQGEIFCVTHQVYFPLFNNQ